jgi:mitogen-activated protein kinase 7
VHVELKQTPVGKTMEGFVVIKQHAGRGASSTVSQVREIASSQSFAVKKLKNLRHSHSLRALLREVKILSLCAHPNLMSLHQFHLKHELTVNQFGQLEKSHTAHIVMPWMDVDMAQLLRSKQPLSLEHVQFFTEQILLGVRHLHNHGILHRDIKPHNIFINADCHLKIGDFGLSRSVHDSTGIPGNAPKDESCCAFPMSGYVGTRWYRAPEIILETCYSFGSDMWAIGCVVAELLGMSTKALHRPLFRGSFCFPLSPAATTNKQSAALELHPQDQLQKIIDVLGPFQIADWPKNSLSDAHIRYLSTARIPSGSDDMTRKQRLALVFGASANDAALDFLSKLLDPSPATRMTADDALRHPFIQCDPTHHLKLCGTKHEICQFLPRATNTPKNRANVICALEHASDR